METRIINIVASRVSMMKNIDFRANEIFIKQQKHREIKRRNSISQLYQDERAPSWRDEVQKEVFLNKSNTSTDKANHSLDIN